MIPAGQHLGEFEIVERLGEDGTGEAYKARQPDTGMLVRLTSLAPSLAGDSEYVGRFHRETGDAALLRHPNLVHVIGGGEAAGVHCHAEEFVADESAEGRIKRKGRIGAANAIAMMVHVANALEYAWKQARLVHRDLRAGNIFISRDGGVKLGGLGLARRFGKASAPVAGGPSADVPHFISPEEAGGDEGIGLRANVYSLGCILFYMVGGRVPFEGDTPATVAMKHGSEPAPDLRTVWPGCVPTLAAVLKRAMEKAPAARYQNYGEFGAALRLAYEAVTAPPISTAPAAAAPATPAPAAIAQPAPAPSPTVLPGAAPVPVVVPSASAHPGPSATVRLGPVPGPAPVPAVSPAPPVTVRPAPPPSAIARPVPGPPVTVRPGVAAPAASSLAVRPPVTTPPGAAPPASGQRAPAPPMGVAPAASVPSAKLFAAPAQPSDGTGRKLKQWWIIGGVLAVVTVGALLYFFVWRKKPSAGGASTQPLESKVGLPKATTGKPFVNSLGMKFVPVRDADVIFSVWETRVQDYAAFAGAKQQLDDTWTKLEHQGTPVGREKLHPVCGVNWDDAKAFCQWLTEKETTEGLLKEGAQYRLPTDVEWSRAVGLQSEEGATPRERSGKKGDDFPWGREWPPRTVAGNYADMAYHEKFPMEKMWLEGFNDGFPTTAPVGSFPANEFGIYDLGGNAWEWCEDLFESGSKDRVLRGGSWAESDRGYLLCSYRIHFAPKSRYHDYGFRCVIAAGERR